MAWKVDFLVFLDVLTSKSVKNGRNDLLFFFKMPHFLRRIWWWYSFFPKIKLNAIFWGIKLKNYGNFRSTTNFVLTLKRVPVSEKNSFFFKKYLIFSVEFDGGVSFLWKPKENPYFCQKCRKIMIFRTSIFGIFGQNRAFSLIFTKNWPHHQNLRKKLGIFKKKSYFFR